MAHYAALDGIRGLSALFVLLFHTGRWLDVPWLAVNGGLSVDTFFTLSGFVLARAYKDRRDRLSNTDFLLQRLVRLMPIIALALFISAPYVALRNYMMSDSTFAIQIVAAVFLGLLNIPYFYAPPQIGGSQVFPLNGPQFSLFFEIVINAFWWSIRHVNPLYASASLYIVSSCFVLSFGTGGDQTDNFMRGFGHVGSSFFIGVFCYQMKSALARRINLRPVFYVLLVVMVVVFAMPYELNHHQRMVWKLLLAPLLVVSGSFVTPSSPLKDLSIFGGDLSYPIYALHFPIFSWINGLYQKLNGEKSAGIEATLFFSTTLILSYLALRFYDKPVRDHLTRLLKATRRPSDFRIYLHGRERPHGP
ncbi:acyltransferase (plasmid) [Methylobacterium sp. NMS14P]|uniref:acyltransferase family protein n=1 Tax=Methylobacterium sp. NMS14P TaxID=2894310 RepID=UPI002359461D|nr:acyltransferase [Methylobacterium sp. NMS14P]WCS28781.1 acyltransferase [Methylobacterium sp. NMS14P]